MKIQNIDVCEDIVYKLRDLKTFSFIREVFRPIAKELDENYNLSLLNALPKPQSWSIPLAPIWQFSKSNYYTVIANLLHTIPIYLRAQRPEEWDEEDIVETLGAYFCSKNCESPYIEIYVPSIFDSVKNDEEYKWLFTLVLIHELAHATLDIRNYEQYNTPIQKVDYNTEFGKWREESMANALALHLIKHCEIQDFYDYALNFVLRQPAEYALGAKYGELREWDYFIFMSSKEDGVDVDLQKLWLDYVKGDPKSKGLRKWGELLSSQYVYFYEGNYYQEENTTNLVSKFVRQALANYKKQHRKKMTYAEFCIMFPLLSKGEQDCYTLAETVKGDSRYSQSFKLADKTIALYYFWDDEMIKQFVVNMNVQYKEYKNY